MLRPSLQRSSVMVLVLLGLHLLAPARHERTALSGRWPVRHRRLGNQIFIGLLLVEVFSRLLACCRKIFSLRDGVNWARD